MISSTVPPDQITSVLELYVHNCLSGSMLWCYERIKNPAAMNWLSSRSVTELYLDSTSAQFVRARIHLNLSRSCESNESAMH